MLRLLAFKPGQGAAAPAEKKTSRDALIATPAQQAPAVARPPQAQRPSAEPPLQREAQQEARPSAEPAPEPHPQGHASLPVAAAPPGQLLPVVEAEARPARRVPHATADAQPASPVLGVPVRVQPESSREGAGARSPTEFTRTEEGDFWYATVRQLVVSEAITALVRELALQSQLVARDTDHWLLRVERESLNQPTARERLQAALQAAGHPVRLGVEIGTVADSPARRNAHAAAERQRAAEELIHADPFVQQMMREFGAKIVPGSIKPVAQAGTHR
jgi:DNA polymerase III subunit gamma/tau